MNDVRNVFGIKDGVEVDFDALIRKGFPFLTARKVQRALDMSDRDFAGFIGGSMSAFRRLKIKRGRLSRLAGDQVYRLAVLFALAVDVLGSREYARRWFVSHLIPLGGRTPLETAKTTPGFEEVEGVLNGIRHGLPL